MAVAATVFRDYETDGVPSSGSHKVKKSDVRQLLLGYENIINAFLSNGGLIFASKASLDADLAHAANSMAWVIGDAMVANNGIYRKIGASGVGSWTRVADLPFSFIIASDTGAGTPNAIQATTSLPVSGSALVWMNVFEANTASPVTVSFNGGTPLTIKTNSGNDVTAGGLTAGMIVMGIVSGSTFRLVSDQASAAIVASAEGWANIAQAAANNNLSFVTRAAASASTISASIHTVMLKGGAVEGDGDGGLFIDADNGNSDTFTSAGGTTRTWYRVRDVPLSRVGFLIESDIAVNIPSDFATLQAAVDFYSRFIVKQGVQIVLNIESGHQPSTGLLVQYGDYTHFIITSTDAEVTLSASFVGVYGPDGPDTITRGSFIMAYSAQGPILNTLVDGNKAVNGTARTCYYVLRNATGGLLRVPNSTEESPAGPPTTGAKNFLHSAIKVQEGSTGYWENGLATNCGTGAIYAERSATIHAEFADASGSFVGFKAARASRIGAGGSKAENCTQQGYWALRACTISAEDSSANGCQIGFQAEQGGEINAHNTTATGCSQTGYYAYRAGRINAAFGNASNCTVHGFQSEEAPGIKAPSAIANNCGTSAVSMIYSEGGIFTSLTADECGGAAIDLNYGSTGTFRSAVVSDALGHGAQIRNNSSADFANASITNSGRAITATRSGIYLDSGSRGNAASATVTGSTGKDLRVNGGSYMNATACTTTNGVGTPSSLDTSVPQNMFNAAGSIHVN